MHWHFLYVECKLHGCLTCNMMYDKEIVHRVVLYVLYVYKNMCWFDATVKYDI